MTALLNYLSDPKNPLYNFILGGWYENQGHTAAAAGFYVRTAEYSNGNKLLCYEALLRVGICFSKQGSRVFVVKGLFLRAISLIPERPEAYFLLSQCYEVNKDWQESYTFASIGLTLKDNYESLKSNVGYPGKYGFTFEMAVSGWWIGLYDESLHLFRQLSKRNDLSLIHYQAVWRNLNNLGNTAWKEPTLYYDSMYEKLKVKFDGSREIKQNYSQCYQDMFVLTVLNGKKHGRFVEIGCGDPFFGNNTALLSKLGWTGLSIDIDPSLEEKWRKSGRAQFIFMCTDATKIDNWELKGDYDYLQIDCDPALNSLEVLLKIPFEKHKFAVITFEHDAYNSEGIKDRSRAYLQSMGYEMVVGDIAPDKYLNFEDWWVHPALVDMTRVYAMYNNSLETKKAEDYMLNK
jgi:hypothetical protein